VRVVTTTTGVNLQQPERVLGGPEIVEIQQLVRQVVVADDVARFAVRLVDASRPGRQSDLDFVREYVKWGAGLRASQALILAGKARALLHGRYHVSVSDIEALAHPVLRHRVIPNFYAESERISSDNLVDRLLDAVPRPRSGM
jgi:MoxR-like ATPase